MTGARDSALASMKLKHVDLSAGSVFQAARDVETKNSKSFPTFFVNVGDDVRQIFDAWVNYLRQEKLWGNDDPLFPATLVEVGDSRQFEPVGLTQRNWSTASPIRDIFRHAFESAGLPYFNPHSFRNTLVQLGMTLCQDAEQFKAWSQNIGHEGVLTTFLSYGTVAARRQRQIIQELTVTRTTPRDDAEAVAQAVVRAVLSVRMRPGQG
jgi:integrase/recombinase XerD